MLGCPARPSATRPTWKSFLQLDEVTCVMNKSVPALVRLLRVTVSWDLLELEVDISGDFTYTDRGSAHTENQPVFILSDPALGLATRVVPSSLV